MTARPVRETSLFGTVAPLEKKPNCKTARVRHARISIVEGADRRTAGHVLSKDGARRLAVNFAKLRQSVTTEFAVLPRTLSVMLYQ